VNTPVASSCGFDAYPDYYDGAERNWFFGRGWCQIRYMPRLSDYRARTKEIPFDFPELLGAPPALRARALARFKFSVEERRHLRQSRAAHLQIIGQ
jgi:hypothetical protein